MALESAGHIAALNSANPTATDGLAQGDDHLRLIKATLLATFPNFTDAALNSTQAAIDGVVATVGTSGVSVLADAGVNFKTNSTDGLRNPVAGEVDVEVGGAVGLKVTAATVTAPAALVATTSMTAASYAGGTGQLVPIGGTLVWWDDVLPTEGGYAWANGQIIASANTVAPVLLARWGSKFGGNGTTTMGVPDMREAAPIGKSTMGSTTTPARITNYVATTIGGFIGACLHLLTTGEMPAHSHANTVSETPHTHAQQGVGASAGGLDHISIGTNSGSPVENSAESTGSATAGVSITNVNAGGGASHDNVSPGVVCNWIIRIG